MGVAISGGLRVAASNAYAHGMTQAAAACAGLLVTCAIACLVFLPGRPAKAAAPES